MPREMILFYNCSICVAGFVLALLGLIMSLLVHFFKPGVRMQCILLFGVVLFYTASTFSCFYGEIIRNLAMGIYGMLFSSLSAAMVMPVVISLILILSGERVSGSPLMKVSLTLLAVYSLMVISTLFSPVFYHISPAGKYTRGPLYPLLLVPPLLSLLIGAAALWSKRKKLTRRQQCGLLVVLLVPALTIFLQMFYQGILLVSIGVVLGTFTMFILILLDQVDQYLLQKEQNARKEFEIRVLQMRPHFIYNVLSSIYYLIDSDSDRAKTVVRDFTVYLRNVFTSVVQTEMIPFEEEVEHTRAYLAVEEARFGEQLHTAFDLPTVAFRIPPLTLQPLVENAVKHGMDPEGAPLNIRVRTQEDGDSVLVVVEDDGVGCKLSDSDDPDTALANIRARLREFCGGTVTLCPGENGRGTRVTLRIPKSGEKFRQR